jgi:hypothetical protein
MCYKSENNDVNDDYPALTDEFHATEPRYAVYDFDYEETEDEDIGSRHKIIFYAW